MATQRKGSVRTYLHTNRLIELVAASGGKTEAEAVASAREFIKTLQGFAFEGIESAVQALEQMVRDESADLNPAEIQDVLSYVDRLVTLSSAFELDRLQEAACCLGELVSGFSALGAGPMEPIAIHVQAARLFAPKSPQMSEVDSQRVIAELRRVHRHFLCSSPIPEDELFRQSVLDQLNILDRPPQEPFDRLTKLAAQYFKAPIALISLIDRDRQWSMSRCGIEVQQAQRDIAFCAHAIMTDDPLVVLDAAQGTRFAANPLVLNEPHIRFYAGAPLISPEGARIGTFCIIDIQPRLAFNERDRGILKNFASRAVEMIYAQVLEALSHAMPKMQLERTQSVEREKAAAKHQLVLPLRSAIERQLRTIEDLGRLLESGVVGDTEAIAQAVGASTRIVQGAMRAVHRATSTESGEFPRHDERIDIASVVTDCLVALGPQSAAKRIEFQVDAGDAPALFTDRVLTEQVFLGLLSQALNEAASGGTVCLRVAPGTLTCEIGVGYAPCAGASADSESQRAIPDIVRILIEAQGGAVSADVDADGVCWTRLKYPLHRIAGREVALASAGGRAP